MELFKDLKDVSLKEVLKNQARFKSDLSEIKIGSKKSSNQTNTIENITNFFDLQEKVINFFRDYSFLISEAKYKTKQEGTGLKILTPKKCLEDYQ